MKTIKIIPIVGLEVCPHCGGADTAHDRHPLLEKNSLDKLPVEFSCENCGKFWEVIYRPVIFQKGQDIVRFK